MYTSIWSINQLKQILFGSRIHGNRTICCYCRGIFYFIFLNYFLFYCYFFFWGGQVFSQDYTNQTMFFATCYLLTCLTASISLGCAMKPSSLIPLFQCTKMLCIFCTSAQCDAWLANPSQVHQDLPTELSCSSQYRPRSDYFPLLVELFGPRDCRNHVVYPPHHHWNVGDLSAWCYVHHRPVPNIAFPRRSGKCKFSC